VRPDSRTQHLPHFLGAHLPYPAALKKAAARRASARLSVLVALLLSNALFLVARVWLAKAKPTSWEWAAAAVVAATQLASAFFFVEAKAAGGKADAATDALALSLCAQVVACWSARLGLIFTALLPLYGVFAGVTTYFKIAAAAKGAASLKQRFEAR